MKFRMVSDGVITRLYDTETNEEIKTLCIPVNRIRGLTFQVHADRRNTLQIEVANVKADGTFFVIPRE